MKALITFTDKDGAAVFSGILEVNPATFPPELDTDEKRLANWLQGANEEPLLALQSVVVSGWKVAGKLDDAE